MSNNFNSDNLESFFQKGLQDELLTDIESDGWDMPSDAVWDNIETGITVRQIRAKKWGNNKPWLSVAAAVLFITIFYQTLTQQQAIDGLQRQIDTQTSLADTQHANDNLKNTDTNNSQNNTFNLASIEANSKEIITTTTKDVDKLVAESTETIPSNKHNLITPPTNILFDESQDQSTHSPSETKLAAGTSQSNHTNYLSTKLEQQQQLGSVHINSKELTTFKSATSGLASDDFTSFGKLVDPLTEVETKKQTYFGPYLGTNLLIAKVKGNRSSEINDLLDNQKVAALSYQSGIKIGYQLSDKWSVESGIAYNKLQQKSEHELQFEYNSDNLNVNTNGEYEGTYAGSLTTSYGTLPIEVVLSHGTNAPNLSEGQVLPFTLKSKQTLEMVQLPVAIRYALGSGRLKLHLSAGATANILTKKDFEIALPLAGVSIPDLVEVGYNDNTVEIEPYLDEINNLTLSLTAGVELDYAITDKLHLYVTPTYSKGVTPIYESEEVDAELSQASVLLGLNYYF